MSIVRASLFTVIGRGFVIALPLLLLVAVIKILFGIVAGLILPLLHAMPGVIFQNDTAQYIAVAVALVFLFFLVGALAGTHVGRSAGHWIEASMLRRLPMYDALCALVAGLITPDGSESMKPVLVTVDVPGLQQFGFLLETHPDGRSTIFLPGSPNPGSGTCVIVEPHRVQALHASAPAVFRCLTRWGSGASVLLPKNAHPPGNGTRPARGAERDA